MPINTLCLAIENVFLAISNPVATRPRSSNIMTTSADSLAAVEPRAPSAIPTSAAVKIGASFTPSPTKAKG